MYQYVIFRRIIHCPEYILEALVAIPKHPLFLVSYEVKIPKIFLYFRQNLIPFIFKKHALTPAILSFGKAPPSSLTMLSLLNGPHHPHHAPVLCDQSLQVLFADALVGPERGQDLAAAPGH